MKDFECYDEFTIGDEFFEELLDRSDYDKWKKSIFAAVSTISAITILLILITCKVNLFIALLLSSICAIGVWGIYLLRNMRKSKREQKASKQTIDASSKTKQKNPIVHNTITAINELKKLSDSIDFGESDKTISSIVTKLYEIVEKIKADNSLYEERFSYLFEVYLPQFCEMLKFYSDFHETDLITKTEIELLNTASKKLYNYLYSPEIEHGIDTELSKIKFSASAKTLINTMDNEK